MKKCIVCGNSNPDVVYSSAHFNVLKCGICSLVYEDTVHSQDKINGFYNHIYDKNMGEHQLPTSILKHYREIYRDIRQATSIRNKSAHLDVGCSYGHMVHFFSEMGWQSEGIDVSEQAVGFARSRGLNCHHVPVDQFRPERKYHIITMNHVFEHFIDPVATLLKIKTWLHSEGLIYIRVPNFNSWSVQANRLLLRGHLKPFEHQFYFTPESLERLIRHTGCRVMVKTCKRISLFGLFNSILRSRLASNNGWHELNFNTPPSQKRVYIKLKKLYEIALNKSSSLTLGPADVELVAHVRI